MVVTAVLCKLKLFYLGSKLDVCELNAENEQ